jgi:hypothetical protein
MADVGIGADESGDGEAVMPGRIGFSFWRPFVEANCRVLFFSHLKSLELPTDAFPIAE